MSESKLGHGTKGLSRHFDQFHFQTLNFTWRYLHFLLIYIGRNQNNIIVWKFMISYFNQQSSLTDQPPDFIASLAFSVFSFSFRASVLATSFCLCSEMVEMTKFAWAWPEITCLFRKLNKCDPKIPKKNPQKLSLIRLVVYKEPSKLGSIILNTLNASTGSSFSKQTS